MKQLNIEQVHAIMLDMAKVFHSLCEKHGVRYYMIGGTQLGAIRHKGFIPWDDDMDFAVPRSDFDRLEEICRNELPEPYKIVECVRGNHVKSYLKIEDVLTSIEDCVFRRFHTRVGINLDIFPLEDCSLDVTKILPYMRKKVFLDRLATHILAYEDNGHVEWFEGNFEDYEKNKKLRLGEDACNPHRIRYKKLER